MEITPIESTISVDDIDKKIFLLYNEAGMKLIADGKVALLITAGGLGTRLCLNYNKLLFDFGMPSHSTIFQYLMRRVKKLIDNVKKTIGYCVFPKILIMVSKESYESINNCIKENEYFGLDNDSYNVFYYAKQLVLMDLNGKLLHSSEKNLHFTQAGNGEFLLCLSPEYNDLISYLKKAEIEYLQIIPNDNPLAKPLDPLAIGILDSKQDEFQILAKAVPKLDPDERVGVFGNINGKASIIDYSALGKDRKELVDESGKLIYGYASILNYFIKMKVLEDIFDPSKGSFDQISKEFNSLKKEIMVYNVDKGVMESMKVLKFEIYLDAIFKYSKVGVLEVKREEEFAPIKKLEGNDTPELACNIISNSFKKWASKAVALPEGLFEIPFELSYDGMDLELLQNQDLTNTEILRSDHILK